MKTNKEYPATHSMDTAWYFVDNEDNVAIFEIEEMVLSLMELVLTIAYRIYVLRIWK